MYDVFDELNVSALFKNSIITSLKSNRLSHALILEQGDAATRLKAATEIACAVLCKGEARPCMECTACRKVVSGNHPDLHILSKEEKSSMIKVDAIRELKKKALVYPNDSDKSVFIIDGAEAMNPQAQNALLKIFEEPASHLLFILCCNSKSSLLDTVISRATIYSLGKADENEGKGEKELKADELANELLFCFVQDNELAFMKKAAAFTKDKELFRMTLQSMIPILRDAIVMQNRGRDMMSVYTETVKRLCTRLTASKILRLLETIEQLNQSSLMNANHNLVLTRFSALFYRIK